MERCFIIDFAATAIKKLVTVYYAVEYIAENLYSAHISDKDENPQKVRSSE